MVLFVMPGVLEPYPLIVLCYALVYSIACLSLNILFGTTGLLSLGHAVYFGAGAYTGAFLHTLVGMDSLEIYLLSGIVCATALAAVLGYFCVQASRMHFAILTLAFTQIVNASFVGGSFFRLFGSEGWFLYMLAGGSMYIPRLTMLGIEYEPSEFIAAFYNYIAGGFLVTVFVLRRIDLSPFGKALRAIRDNEIRAESIGIPVRRYRWLAFVISGLFMGLAGALYGQLNRQITPEQLGWLFSAILVLATVLGGVRQFAGPVIGAFAYAALDEFALHWAGTRNMVMGILLIAVVCIFPMGIAGTTVAVADHVKRLAKKRFQTRHQPPLQ
ncbi:MAG: branched-chain amino acid ABC transporter permease [Rhodospirillales bacterium]|nr:branched-chain amino acid ABC transporter permease [Rhodospirillales bacterium]MDP6773553.1 branched-chain amino acid ABC transporter permease [Rhodospirillales bacterium]